MADILQSIARLVGIGPEPAPPIGADVGPGLPRDMRAPNMPVAPFDPSPARSGRARLVGRPGDRYNVPTGDYMPMGPTGAGRTIMTPTAPQPLTAREQRMADRQSATNLALRDHQSTDPVFPREPGVRGMSDLPMGPSAIYSPPTIDAASRATNVPVSFIERLIGHESGGDDAARNPNSSAVGAGQFIKSTWLRLMNEHGAQFGFDPARHSEQETLALQTNHSWNELMIGFYANENAQEIERALPGRKIDQRDLYLAHFLGADTAIEVLRARREGRGAMPATTLVNQAAVRANHSAFYVNGRRRTVDEFYAWQTRNFGGQGSDQIRRSQRR